MSTFHPDPKAAARHVATREEWKDLVREKAAPCRVCGSLIGLEMHHLVNRSQQGDDVADNLIPLCIAHHGLITRRDHATAHAVRASLTPEEAAYCAAKKSWAWLDERYPEGGGVLCSRCKRPVRAQEPRSAPRKRSRWQCSVPDDEEDGAAILDELIQSARERLAPLMGWSGDVAAYYVLVAVLHFFLTSNKEPA